MHLYKIKTKNGKEYTEVLITTKDGIVSGDSLCTILREAPCIYLIAGNARGVVKLPLTDLEYAICEKERVGVEKISGAWHAKIRDVDELPDWLELHQIYKEHKTELDGLANWQKMLRVLELRDLLREK